MERVIAPLEVFANVMNLRVAVMARRDAIRGSGFPYLFELELAVVTAMLGHSRLQEAAAAAATIVV